MRENVNEMKQKCNKLSFLADVMAVPVNSTR